jgi:hypothetical protein
MHIGTRVIILAAGSGERWGNYLGVPKHLIEIDEEKLIERTVRQFNKYSDEILVVSPKDHRYAVNGALQCTPKTNPDREMDKFISSSHLWGDQSIVLVYGDVYFTDEAVEKIMTYSGDWKYFCRPWPSEKTGKNCKEIFAIYVPPHQHKYVKENINKIANLQTATGGWSLFRQLTLGRHVKGADEDKAMFEAGSHIVIDDMTEDFDYPKDYDNWCKFRDYCV